MACGVASIDRIHSSDAVVDASVTIGPGSRVWQFSTLIRGALIGARCNIAHGACIDGSRIGDDCVIGHNVAMGPGFWVGDGCFIGPGVVFANDAFPRAHKRGWSADAFNGNRFAVIVEDGASIGANAVILPGVRIGAGAMVAACAAVSRDVPAGHLWISKGDVRPIQGEPERIRFARDLLSEAA